MSVSSSHSSVSRPLPRIRLKGTVLLPLEWTLVEECSIEKKDPYKLWSSKAQYQIELLRDQLLLCMESVKLMDKDIEIEQEKLNQIDYYNSSPKGPPNTTENTQELTTNDN